jgi:dTDP-4-amino-4,6-dideoxygalactose transaminase
MKTYPLFKVFVPKQAALAKIGEVFDSGFINEGTQVTQLTNELRGVLNANNLILTNACTSALTLALHLSDVGPGDNVVSSPMTCVAGNVPIVNLGADIVWGDVDPRHGMLNPQDVARKITNRTKAVMAVAWAGTPPQLQELREICLRAGVKFILDAAHAFDAGYRGAPVHEWADHTCYSFQAIKHFTTGDGGALVCLNPDDHRRAKALKWFGLDRDRAKDDKGNWKGQQWDVDIEEVGYKFNMNNVAAAIGLAQLEHVNEIVAFHRVNAHLYDDLFEGCSAVTPTVRPAGAESSFWVYTMKVDPNRSRLTRDELLKALNAEGIMAGVVHVPNDGYVAFRPFRADLPGVREFSSNQFNLPCGWWLSDNDVRHIASRVKELTQ